MMTEDLKRSSELPPGFNDWEDESCNDDDEIAVDCFDDDDFFDD
jgi:hypothetical protein